MRHHSYPTPYTRHASHAHGALALAVNIGIALLALLAIGYAIFSIQRYANLSATETVPTPQVNRMQWVA